MANTINRFVDNMQLSIETSLTHLLHSENSDELNVIRHSPYISDDELFQQRVNCKNGLSILQMSKFTCKIRLHQITDRKIHA